VNGRTRHTGSVLDVIYERVNTCMYAPAMYTDTHYVAYMEEDM